MSPELGFPGDPGRLIRDGLLLEVHIGHTRQLGAPVPHLHPQQALIDTGARDCYVDIGLAEELQLKKVDREAVTGVTGERLIVNIFSAHIRIEALDITLLDPCPSYPIRRMRGPFGVILGRSFLQRVKLSYDGSTGSVQLTPPGPGTGWLRRYLPGRP